MKKFWYHQIWIQNYFSFIVSDLTYLPTVDIGFGNSLTVLSENLHIVDISSTTHLPRLVNVVKERPPKAEP